ncbi:MAG: GPW/gp25 family protein [Cellvibrionaceae bacterium]|nr:GPW/gp25 family protein [Cellvibrionaceae bacterium]
MHGINAHTGKRLSGIEHLRQSVRDILTTRIGTRVMRRDYGSNVPNLVDAPMNGATIAKIISAAADALDKWEPRLRIDNLQIHKAEPGQLELEITGEYLPDGQAVELGGIVVEASR